MSGCRVVFTPSGHHGTVDGSITVLDSARRLGVDLDSVCGGRGICGRCAVVPMSGTFAKWALTCSLDQFGARNTVEQDCAVRRGLAAEMRLGCQLRVTADAVFDIPATSQVHRPVVRKHVDIGDLTVDPLVRICYVEVPRAVLGEDDAVAARIGTALARDHGVDAVTWPVRLLPRLHAAVSADGTVTVALHGDDVLAVWPGYVDRVYGVAVDVGSTTVAGHLCDLESGEVVATGGLMNPQIRFGEDLMSRVSYVMLNEGGAAALTSAIREALDALVRDLARQASVDLAHVLDVVIVGNPVMHHTVLGIDPTPLGTAPFELATSAAVHGAARDIGLTSLPDAALYVGPCIAGHVGADTAAAILREGPHRGDGVELLVDIGTNAEIVLGNRDGLYAASSPTGPAFEGGQISCGQRATVGAIERVRVDRDTFEPRFKVIGCDLWSDDAGFADALALGGIGVTGVCGSGIVEVVVELARAGLLRPDGRFEAAMAERTERLRPDGRTHSYVLFEMPGTRLQITQQDVRAVQLAKGALRAGVELLCDRSGLRTIDEVRLAGAFGSHLDPEYAVLLGLVPAAASVRQVGNAAGAGAVRALLSRSERLEMEAVVARVTKVETAIEPAFQEHFVAAMALSGAVTKETT